jgi:hypothetical protein
LSALSPGGRTGIHCIGGWVGPKAGLGGCGKSRLLPGLDPRNVQAVASRCIDRAIPVIHVCVYQFLYDFVLVKNQRFYIHVSCVYVMRRLHVILQVFYNSNQGVILFAVPACSGYGITNRIVGFDSWINSSEVAKEIFWFLLRVQNNKFFVCLSLGSLQLPTL